MKRVILILLCLTVLSNKSPALTRDHSLFIGTNKNREIFEWSLSIGLASFNRFCLAHSSPWAKEPLLSTNFKPYLNGETVPNTWIYVSGFLFNAAIFVLPNRYGCINRTSYRHCKGFIETSLVYTPLFTSIAKLVVGKKRPNYDNTIHAKDNDARKSFWSGHSSSSFAISTYFNLYMYHYLGNNNMGNLLWKIPLSLFIYGAAGYVAWSRVYDHVHDELDVTVGAGVGTGISILIFGVHNNWFGKFYYNKK